MRLPLILGTFATLLLASNVFAFERWNIEDGVVVILKPDTPGDFDYSGGLPAYRIKGTHIDLGQALDVQPPALTPPGCPFKSLPLPSIPGSRIHAQFEVASRFVIRDAVNGGLCGEIRGFSPIPMKIPCPPHPDPYVRAPLFDVKYSWPNGRSKIIRHFSVPSQIGGSVTLLLGNAWWADIPSPTQTELESFVIPADESENFSVEICNITPSVKMDLYSVTLQIDNPPRKN